MAIKLLIKNKVKVIIPIIINGLIGSLVIFKAFLPRNILNGNNKIGNKVVWIKINRKISCFQNGKSGIKVSKGIGS